MRQRLLLLLLLFLRRRRILCRLRLRLVLLLRRLLLMMVLVWVLEWPVPEETVLGFAFANRHCLQIDGYVGDEDLLAAAHRGRLGQPQAWRRRARRHGQSGHRFFYHMGGRSRCGNLLRLLLLIG